MCDYAPACQNALAGLRAQHAVIAAPQQPLRVFVSYRADRGGVPGRAEERAGLAW